MGFGGAYLGLDYFSLTWGHPRWWFPWGYGPYWYGPYWYGWYGYDRDYYGYDEGSSLKFDVKPKNAEVYLDGYLAGVVDDFDGFFQSLGVTSGPHSVTLWCQGYRSVTQQVYLQAGQSLKLQYQMVPLATGESQDPRPVPPAEVSAPGVRAEGGSPPEPAGPPARPARPLQPEPPRMMVEPARPEQPAPPAGVGEAPNYSRLTIRVQPAGAQVLIDGEAWQTSPDAERLIVHLPIGTHHVEVRKDGFKTFKTDVQVRAGETTTLNVSLSGQDIQ